MKQFTVIREIGKCFSVFVLHEQSCESCVVVVLLALVLAAWTGRRSAATGCSWHSPLATLRPCPPTCLPHRTWILRFLCSCQEAPHLHSTVPTPVLFAGQQRGLCHQKNSDSFHPRKKRDQERNQTLVHVKTGVHHSILCVLLRWAQQKHVHRNGARQWW